MEFSKGVMLYPKDEFILKLPPNTLKRIINVLDRDCAWQKIVEMYPTFTPTEYETQLHSPSEEIVVKLTNKLCTVKNLRDILQGCNLYDALSILYNEKIEIEQQPAHDIETKTKLIKRGTPFILDLIVRGVPLPKYYWYHNKSLLSVQSSSQLHYSDYSPDMEGEYYCMVVQTFDNGVTRTLTSTSVQVETQPERCVIIKQPPPEISKFENDTITLKIFALGYPEPKYEWAHRNKILLNQTGNSLKVLCTRDRQGEYSCRVWNCANEVIVRVHITVLEVGSLYKCVKAPVIKKVALLIGNQNYKNLDPLSSAASDVDDLWKILNDMGFVVLKLFDAPLKQMLDVLKLFCNELVKGAYALLYFAGHGFEFGEKYLLPVDCPDPQNYVFESAVCEYFILREVLRTEPKLFLLILDMCLVYPERFENSKIYNETKGELYKYESNRNLIQCYSTTSGQSAYEIKGNSSCSLFISVFKKYLKENISVLKILAKTNEEFERKHSMVNQQPCITLNVTKDFYLNGPLLPPSENINH